MYYGSFNSDLLQHGRIFAGSDTALTPSSHQSKDCQNSGDSKPASAVDTENGCDLPIWRPTNRGALSFVERLFGETSSESIATNKTVGADRVEFTCFLPETRDTAENLPQH